MMQVDYICSASVIILFSIILFFLDPSDGVFGRFDLAALFGCHTLDVCHLMLCYNYLALADGRQSLICLGQLVICIPCLSRWTIHGAKPLAVFCLDLSAVTDTSGIMLQYLAVCLGQHDIGHGI